MIPTAELRVEVAALNPPKPLGYHVLVDGKSVAVLRHETVKAAYESFTAMEALREKD